MYLKARCSNVACILVHGNTEISALVHIVRSIQLLIKRLIHNQRHSLELVGLYVAVKKPEPRIFRYEVDHDVPPGRKNYRVLLNRLPINAEIWLIVPDWLRAEGSVTALSCTCLIFTTDIGVKLLNEASVWIVIRVSYVNNVECTSVHMYRVRYRYPIPI